MLSIRPATTPADLAVAHTRGTGLGRQLAERICAEAREAGYTRMRLDTVPTMTAAQGIYRGLGFREIDAYVFNPVPAVRYLELALR